jgi:hypothetical protein
VNNERLVTTTEYITKLPVCKVFDESPCYWLFFWGDMMDKPELKPCPFCGGEAKKIQTPGSYGGYHLTTIQCQTCFATNTDSDKWNARINPLDIPSLWTLDMLYEDDTEDSSCH